MPDLYAGFGAAGITRGIDDLTRLHAAQYGDGPAVTDLIAAVEARAKREERERILQLMRGALKVGDDLQTVLAVVAIKGEIDDV